jgi:hypothetical protein
MEWEIEKIQRTRVRSIKDNPFKVGQVTSPVLGDLATINKVGDQGRLVLLQVIRTLNTFSQTCKLNVRDTALHLLENNNDTNQKRIRRGILKLIEAEVIAKKEGDTYWVNKAVIWR